MSNISYYNVTNEVTQGGYVMNTVQPIRNKEQIEEIKSLLLKKGHRDYFLFVLGINTGLRVSDMLKLKVSDIKDRSHITIKEQKTGKAKRFLINSLLEQEISKYAIGMKPTDYLFASKGSDKPITRIQAYRILNYAADMLGLEEIGTHTMRKTFGYWHYQKYKDVAILQSIFNHSAPSITLRYIGITDDIKDKTIEDFYL
jgi:integrase